MKNKLLDFCDISLINTVFNEINIGQIESNVWHFDNAIYDIPINKLFELLKTMYVFEKMGGVLKINDSTVDFQSFIKKYNNENFNKIISFWENNIANNYCPRYSLGNLVVPIILPVYIATQYDDYKWYIEKLIKGEYLKYNHETFPFEDIAKERARELNIDYLDYQF